ncbi:hypothetical protein WJX73_001334 [Symbiochloris irregularis]|uniref:Cyclic nucleotide-binding domain-containing protein n=1 Tax=Symbiochloris irregularis TaxID=706552 RepID=A0AAW1P898_9CHLO
MQPSLGEGPLLPRDLADFRTSKFWNGFFLARKKQAFEWYGGWSDLQTLLTPLLPKTDQNGAQGAILVPGCGNSDLSAGLYDLGHTNITNIDFSAIAIKEMLGQHLRARPKMRWQVMDMLHTKFQDGAFSAVVDKGALDALASDESDKADAAVQRYLVEMQRVLDPDEGIFICVTLAQEHNLQCLLDAFDGPWHLRVMGVPPSPSTASDPLQPMLFLAVRGPILTGAIGLPSPEEETAESIPAQGEASGSSSPAQDEAAASFPEQADAEGSCWYPAHVKYDIKATEGVANSEQLASAVKVLEEENARRRIAREPHKEGEDISEGRTFLQLHPGRQWTIYLHTPVRRVESGEGEATELDLEDGGKPKSRYTATVMDMPAQHAATASRECCVFLIPQGREGDWLFTDPNGQFQVAKQCGARRVILVAFNRGHEFGTKEAVTAELSKLVRPLMPESVRDLPGAVPFTTTEQDIGARRTVAEVTSSISGRILVEDMAAATQDVRVHGIAFVPGMALRRLIFASHLDLVQSEALLVPAQQQQQQQQNGLGKAANGTGKSKGSSAKKAAKAKSRAVKAPADLLAPKALDHGVLMCGYQRAMVLQMQGMLGKHMQPPAESCSSEQQPNDKALVIGLGGGALPAYLRQYIQLDVLAVELDEAIVNVAREHFEFRTDEHLQVRVGDGIDIVAELSQQQPGSYRVLIIDAGTGDATVAMACPPAAFLTPEFLTSAAALLQPVSLLMLNCVTRSSEAFDQALRSIKAQFQHVWVHESDGDVNRLVFASQVNLREQDSTAPKPKKTKAQKRHEAKPGHEVYPLTAYFVQSLWRASSCSSSGAATANAIL